MTQFVVMYFVFDSKVILNPFSIYTQIGDSVVSKIVYRGCEVSFYTKETMINLFELVMVDFDFILRKDWLHSFYPSLD